MLPCIINPLTFRVYITETLSVQGANKCPTFKLSGNRGSYEAVTYLQCNM